jgi:hypothetical protein
MLRILTFNIIKHSLTTLGIAVLNIITTLSITLSIMTSRFSTLSFITLRITIIFDIHCGDCVVRPDVVILIVVAA